ncbi:MAG: DUF547 domain-containing protein [Prochloraceae cyanobacterium]|nr:DUF547 domain-containing protein [Prochloraceae cyanobacterium]
MLDFQPWDELLKQYVDSQGKINYQAWKAHSKQKLTNWLEQLASIDPQKYTDPNQQLALWINLYNALVIDRVLEKYPIDSIFPKFLGVPNPIAFLRFFSRRVYKIGDRDYSLNNIEHGIIRQQFNEPRIHFALVCAAVGCPLLRNEAYFPEKLPTQLYEDAKRFINNPDKVHYNLETNTLYCSQIFKWYGKDFLKVANSLPEYFQTYLSSQVELNSSTSIRYLDYDWNLNQRISS